MKWIPSQLLHETGWEKDALEEAATEETEEPIVEALEEPISVETKNGIGQKQAVVTQESDVNQNTISALQKTGMLDLKSASQYVVDGIDGVLWNIQLYLEQVDSSVDSLQQAVQEEHLQEYVRGMHGLKSHLMLIGARELVRQAQDIEIG